MFQKLKSVVLLLKMIVSFVLTRPFIANCINTNLNAIFFLSRTSDELNADVESSRRIDYDGLRRVILCEIIYYCTHFETRKWYNY